LVGEQEQHEGKINDQRADEGTAIEGKSRYRARSGAGVLARDTPRQQRDQTLGKRSGIGTCRWSVG
jgi:hypothetical protein